jgi:hypothetical protein
MRLVDKVENAGFEGTERMFGDYLLILLGLEVATR